jgi:hypothetical protein
VDGEVYAPFAVTPPVDIRMRESVILFNGQATKTVDVSLTGGERAVKGSAIDRAAGWNVSPSFHTVDLPAGAGEAVYRTQITPRNGASSGTAYAEFETGGVRTQSTLETVKYKHIPRQVVMAPARASLIRSDIKSPGGRVGYIAGAGDELPAAMQQLGYRVNPLSDDDLALADLSGYDVIVAGIRVYNTRPSLRRNQERLLQYVAHGGTYVVHYVTAQRGESEGIGPYPLSISRDRVSEEDAPVNMLAPNHTVFTSPNRITAQDFSGWIQERGLYFADRWDARYDSLLSSHDAGEPWHNGGLLITRYGQGTFVYNAYAFFRQLPAGVEGAYRLFANILALRPHKTERSQHGQSSAAPRK